VASYIPPTATVTGGEARTKILEHLAHVTGRPPIMASEQLVFLTKGAEPISEKAIKELHWTPLSVEEGLKKYLH